MSRSHRKVPIIGHAVCSRERQDKRWHRRWRAGERTQLTGASTETLSAYLPLLENEVSNTSLMGKDGRFYWSKSSQIVVANRIAGCKGRTPEEQASIRTRLLRKWASK
ncbi:hypothetical protein AAKU61_003837 [Undibacterium sp. GrIS 1.2]